MEKIPEHGLCFVCGVSNPKSIGVEWHLDPGNQIDACFTFSDAQQGPHGFVHGGASAAVLDEAMGLAIIYSGQRVVTTNLSVDYRKPIPIGQPVRIHAVISGRTERRILAIGEIILPDGSIAVSSKGTYAIADHFFEKIALQTEKRTEE